MTVVGGVDDSGGGNAGGIKQKSGAKISGGTRTRGNAIRQSIA